MKTEEFLNKLGLPKLDSIKNPKVYLEFDISHGELDTWYDPNDRIDPNARGLISINPSQMINRLKDPTEHDKAVMANAGGFPTEYFTEIEILQNQPGYRLRIYGVVK